MTPYHVRLVNPKTSAEITITVLADAAAAEAAPCLDTYLYAIYRLDIPDGMMPIGASARRVMQ
jgi:hypothetical protein